MRNPESAMSANQVAPVQDDGLRPYPYKSDGQCQDPDQHGLPGYCLICGMDLQCFTKVKHGQNVTWHAHPVEVENGVEWHNVKIAASGNWAVNKRIQRPDGKQEPPIPIKRADWVMQ